MKIKKFTKLSMIPSLALIFSVNVNSSNDIQRGGSDYVYSFTNAEDFAYNEIKNDYKNKSNLNIRYNVGVTNKGICDINF